MKEKLKAALLKAGLNEGLADFITVTSDEEITRVIEGMKGADNSPQTLTAEEMFQSQTLNDYLAQEGGFEKAVLLNKALQSAHDKKVAQGITTFKSKILGEDGKPTATPQSTPPTGEAPEWAKSLIQEIADLKKGKEKDSKMETAKGLMAKAKLPEKFRNKWLTRLNVDGEDLAEQIKSLEEEYKDLHVGIVGEEAYQFQEGDTKKDPKKMTQADADELTQMAKNL